MNRRDWLNAMGALGAGSILANLEALPSVAAQSSGCVWETSITRLKLRHTWTTTMSSSEYRDTIQVRLTSDGITGVGEGAPIVRYHESAEEGKKAIESITRSLCLCEHQQFRRLATGLKSTASPPVGR